MSDGFQFLIPGDPVPKGRPRVYRGHAVTPQRTIDGEQRVLHAFREEYPQAEPLECAVELGVEFWTAKRGRPDIDNLVKLVMDALNGVAYHDDAQIISLRASKIQPDAWVQGVRGPRKRRGGDPCTRRGIVYQPVTIVTIRPIQEPTGKGEQQ